MPDDKRKSFPPSLRLRNSREFRHVREKGRKIHTNHFLVFLAGGRSGPARLGITASRKVGGSIQRNRIKRLVREFFRLHQDRLPPGTDISVIAKKGAPTLDFHRVCQELDFLRQGESS